ncbi:ATP-binding protein [Mesorhizobium sp.]|uniref:YobI family P-loop NTPase n=1 Tax=Mesorhizobium sp. TaxID=1871066 RepID=UPI0025FE69B1|nr:ATP-binding protein [Mesorhizobium sp.]
MSQFDFFSKLELLLTDHDAGAPPPRYVDLAPTDKADKSGIYSDALTYATNNPNVSNIALTGPYGSGKSSIIKTFLTKYERPFLPISLAAFLPEADGSVTTTEGRHPQRGTVSKQEIERSILQQMLYGADANKLPLSRFKRIQSPGWSSWLISLFIIVGLIACWHLLQNSTEILSGAFFKPRDLTNWFNFVSFSVGFLFLWQLLHYIYVKSLGVSLKSISLQDIEIAPETAAEESILNRHLDEIVYFFQSTKYDLVIIEDLDRFNNPDIFVTLREINSLINANAGVKRQIRFLYALRDNMFVNTDRTKFFEFIIPVIPIINSSNSIDKVIEQGERLSLDKRLDRQFLREVSRYLNDLRLIQNIFNEYAVYVANLETDGENILDANKLLAILIYKNVLPSDFEELHREKGKLADILHRHDNYVANSEISYKDQISELEKNISNAEKQLPTDLDELRKIYAMTLLTKAPSGYTMIEFNGARNEAIQIIGNHQQFDELIETPEILFRSPQGHAQRINIRGLQKEVNSEKTYQERKAELDHKSGESKDAAALAVRDLRAKISTLRTTKFNEIIRSDAKGTQELFEAFGENKELVRFLVFEGFLDDSYYQYTSLFHSGRLSPNDNKYLIQIRSFNNPSPDFQIDNPKEVIAAMREDDFRQPFALNKALVDCMFSDPREYGSHIEKLIAYISSNFSMCGTFFSIYYERGKRVTELTSALTSRWPGFVSAAISSPDSASHIARMIAHLPEKDISSLHQKASGISENIASNLSQIVALGIDFEPSRLALIKFELKDLRSIREYPAIARLIAEEGQYELSVENVEFVFRDVYGLTAIRELQVKHYTTVLRTENPALIDKVQSDFDLYLKNILIQSNTNTEEEVETIIEVINHDEIDGKYLEQFIAKQSAKLPSLDQVPARLHSMMFRHRTMKASWENCLAYLAGENFDPMTLTAYLDHDESLSILSSTAVADQDSALPLRQFLLNNSDFSDSAYRTYIRALPKQFKQFPDGVSLDKLQILIEEKTITFSEASFAFLEGKEDLQVLYVANNIDRYLADKAKFTLDDDFRQKLLISKISDDRKLKIIADMDLTSLASLPDRASVIGQIFHRAGADFDDLSAEVAQALVIHSKPIATQISLFNRYQKALSDEEIWATLNQLPKPFSEIEPGWKQPTIPTTPENLELVEWLESRSIISSSKPALFSDEIRVYNRRKKG